MAISSQHSYYWPLSLSFPPVFLSFFIFSSAPLLSKHKLLFSHPPLWPVICLFEVSVTQSPVLQWRMELGMFHTSHSMSKQHDELMKCHDHVIELGFYFPARLPKQKSLSLDIQWWHMVVSPFHPRFWFVITKTPILMRWYTDSDTCLADFYEVYMWLNIWVRIVLMWLFHQLTVGYVFYFLYYLLPWRIYWCTT